MVARRLAPRLLGGGEGECVIRSLVILNSDGAVLGRLAIANRTPAGTRIEGIHDIEEVGWFDNASVYVEDDINPYVNDYRVINIASGEMRSFGGFGFATCAASGIVAFWKPVFPQDGAMILADSRRTQPLYEIKNVPDLPTLNMPLTWVQGCDAVGFIDPQLSEQHQLRRDAERRFQASDPDWWPAR